MQGHLYVSWIRGLSKPGPISGGGLSVLGVYMTCVTSISLIPELIIEIVVLQQLLFYFRFHSLWWVVCVVRTTYCIDVVSCVPIVLSRYYIVCESCDGANDTMCECGDWCFRPHFTLMMAKRLISFDCQLWQLVEGICTCCRVVRAQSVLYVR